MLATPNRADAAYAFASNQISGLGLEFLGGSALPVTGFPFQSINAQALTFGYPSSSGGKGGVVGAPLNAPQAKSGPGPFPGENLFTPAPALLGTRGDSAISGGTTGFVSVSNVAEGRGVSGVAQSGNDATISFAFTVASGNVGKSFRIFFSDLIQLITQSGPFESASAAVANSVKLVKTGTATPILDTAPSSINLSVGSNNGTPPLDQVGPVSHFFSIVSAPLTAGSYTITLQSQSRISLTSFTPVSEPASFAVLGLGLLGMLGIRQLRQRDA